MSDFPKPRYLFDGLDLISTLSPCSIGSIPIGGGIITAGTAWPSNNLGIFVPFRIAQPFTFSKMGIVVSSASGNLDLGVYSADGTKIVSSGSTAVGSNVNTVSVTSTTIGPGLFYMAASFSTTAAQVMCYVFSATAKAGLIRALGVSQMASALALPATATFAANTGTIIPIMGLTNRGFF